MNKLKQLRKELEEKNDISIEIIQKDLASEEAAKEIYNYLIEKNIEVSYLVNNAVFGQYGEFINIDLERHLSMINVNIKVLTEFTRLFLPSMISNNFGYVLNIASTAAFLPGPFQSVYATKAYVLSFSQGIAEEVADKNINVTAYCPSATDTEFAKSGDLEDTALFKKKIASVQKIALKAYNTMKKGKLVGISSPLEGFGFRWVFPLLSMKSILKISRNYMKKTV